MATSSTMITRRILVPTTVAFAAIVSACGDSGPNVELTAAGQRGYDLMRDNGCAACHGSNGQGGVGPSFVGLFGADVALDDETTVTADRAYLAESISDPGAAQVDGYRLKMPPNNLSPDEIDSVVDYIVELADAGG